MNRVVATLLLWVAILASADSFAFAEPTELVLSFDRPQLITLTERPATIVLENAGVADVTLDGLTLFIHPRSYGFTSLLILNGDGAAIGDYTVRVVYEDPLSVSVYTPRGRRTYTCASDCERTLRIGDETGHASAYIGDSGMKSAFAGQQQGDSGEVITKSGSPPQGSRVTPPAP